MLADNPRAVIGHNGAPEEPDTDLLFIDARLVEQAASYIQFRFQHWKLEAMLAKGKKYGHTLAFRRVLCYCLREIVAVDNLARLVGLNRKTMAEDQQSVRIWADDDDAFAEDVENLRLAVLGHISINVERFADALMACMADEPQRRKEEKLRRAAIAAEKRKLLAKAKSRQEILVADRAKFLAALSQSPRDMARALTANMLAVLGMVITAESHDKRHHASALDKRGLLDSINSGLVRSAEPHLSKSPDPAIGATDFGKRVYLEALSMGRVEKPRRGK